MTPTQGPSKKGHKCFAEIKGLPGWIKGETYIAPSDRCTVRSSGCSQYVVFDNASDLEYDVVVEVYCDGVIRHKLAGAVRVRYTKTAYVPPDGRSLPLEFPLTATGNGHDQATLVKRVLIKPINGYKQYLPAYRGKLETPIRVDGIP